MSKAHNDITKEDPANKKYVFAIFNPLRDVQNYDSDQYKYKNIQLLSGFPKMAEMKIIPSNP